MQTQAHGVPLHTACIVFYQMTYLLETVNLGSSGIC